MNLLLISIPTALSTLNESGKSTLGGLAAIIFGLPASSDPTKFGHTVIVTDDPPRFDGELYFAVDQQEYHLTRDFATTKSP